MCNRIAFASKVDHPLSDTTTLDFEQQLKKIYQKEINWKQK